MDVKKKVGEGKRERGGGREIETDIKEDREWEKLRPRETERDDERGAIVGQSQREGDK